MLANEFIRLPYQFVSAGLPGVPQWGQGHKDFMRQWYRRSIAIQGPTQEIPIAESRVQVDPKVKDFWGVPVARLSGGKHPKTMETAAAMAEKAQAWLKAAGAMRTGAAPLRGQAYEDEGDVRRDGGEGRGVAEGGGRDPHVAKACGEWH